MWYCGVMFVRVKRSGARQYLQIVQNFPEGKKVRQRVIANLWRLDILRATGALDSIVTSLVQFSENAAVVSGIKEGIDFIVGVRLRNVKEVREEVLCKGGVAIKRWRIT